ncbi:hypothetical protein RJ640_005724 [Escallonia rubra]|uniref:Phytocyanin domain-containing protein n=1 Tax=Escallonia rubra TaxID=112253 RepID=A0AA88UW03_9ASTE|nr:hypothetical protein RJ640_005724 [Escallonia rubra]
MAGVKLFTALLLVFVTIGGQWAAAQVHHVVGGDGGWNPSSNLGSWSSGRTFRIGDKIWFTYAAAQEKIVEVKSMNEYLTCDVTNPIRMFTDGLDEVVLESEGARFFTSGDLDNCKNGLKLHVDVKPHESAMAAGPTPSAAVHITGLYMALIGLLLCSIMAL